MSSDRRHINSINHSLLEKPPGFVRCFICVTPEVKQYEHHIKLLHRKLDLTESHFKEKDTKKKML